MRTRTLLLFLALTTLLQLATANAASANSAAISSAQAKLATDADKPGEFSTPSTPPLDSAQRARLRALVASDPEAAALAAALRTRVEPLLDLPPRPLRVIHYEGLVNTDPRRIATVEKLRDTASLALVLRHWQATDDARAADTLRHHLLAWAETYQPTGNDVNENKLHPLFVAYEALRDSFAPGERERIDAWIARLAELHARAVRESRRFNNRYAKHVRLLALFGRILDRADWRDTAGEGLRRFVVHSLRADGGSLDLEQRDTLTYHTSALRPMIELALLAGTEGPALYAWESPAGGSLKKSVDHVVPYASGEKTREEWRNTTVELDRRRAAAGLEEYRPGRLYEPKNALPMLEEASVFDPSLRPLVLRLHDSPAARFASWTMVVNSALRP